MGERIIVTLLEEERATEEVVAITWRSKQEYPYECHQESSQTHHRGYICK
jgi:hypothetical protein